MVGACHAKEHSDRFNKNAETVEDAAFFFSAETIGEDKKDDGNDGDHPQSPAENVKGALKSDIEDIFEIRFVIRRKLHDKAHALFLRGKRIAENFIYGPHHQEHKEEERYDHQKTAGTAKKRDGDGRNDGEGGCTGNCPGHGDSQYALAPVITTRVPVVPAMVHPSPMKKGMMVFPCKPTFDMVWSKRKEIRAR